MGKKSSIPFAGGNQYAIQMYDYATQIGQLDHVSHKLERLNEINLLRNKGVKFSEKNLVFATKDTNGKVVWLEKGNDKSGLKHIVNKHAKDFNDVYGVKKKDIPGFVKNLVSSGNLLNERLVIKDGKPGFERIYEYNNKHFTVSGIGTNGYIVSVYPVRRK
ncbi:MAG: hypothetical protein SPJ17_05415 [Anaeroplasma sp.]|uniref:hypothetical protein n=1 Tax=Anaeroplasma sp. TaxID=1872523 RepID=UPI002A90A5FF|nr:hypothetical protein [Anaeroplasma sp.]MDY5983115.1 hypothetical protein [Anaeroplasma sp.]